MKKSDEFLNESVFNVNLYYTRLQNKTKEIFFQCLEEDRDEDYFKQKIEKLWNNLDRSYMDEQLEEYRNILRQNRSLLIEEPISNDEVKSSVFDLISAVVIIGYEKKFVKQKEKEYHRIKK